MKKLLLIPILMFVVSGCVGGAGGKLIASAIPTVIDFVGKWFVPKVEEEIGLDIKAVADGTKAIVKQTLTTAVEDLGHATVDEFGLLDIDFTSPKNGDKVKGVAKKNRDGTLTIDITSVDGESLEWTLEQVGSDES
jgi:hypothetical protein